ncbi:helix-turn-helix domain-containing protein [Microbacterium excoecariae]|uniref:helix-turn-helix domain-containing protein n=1 Tax=Microbacterium excoecariae TaxID=2715210 RepID=UPI0014098294|nr:XRE family transcriptional regulator [Microbacterium excoecariae]NHI17894.1 helix-turn-helix transcriptional regulator [Microbacterium excoecariae]
MSDTAGARLGAAIRARRRALDLTIVQLAERADLSHPFVSQLERGRANPSLESLSRLARALGTSQVELMSGTSLDAPEAAVGSFGGADARVLTSGDTRFTVIDVTGAVTELGEFYTHPEDEFVTVIAGEALIDAGPGGPQRVPTGGSLYYRGGTPHRWASADGAPYRLMVVKERGPRGGAGEEKGA